MFFKDKVQTLTEESISEKTQGSNLKVSCTKSFQRKKENVFKN